MGGRGMACHSRPCGEAAEDGGGLTSLMSRGRTTPTPPPRPGSGKAAPPKGTPSPPPKAPRTATPVERAEPAAGRGQRGAVHEWVEQQQLLQRAGAWEARAISAEAANRDLEARLSLQLLFLG